MSKQLRDIPLYSSNSADRQVEYFGKFEAARKKRIQMHRTVWIDGNAISYKRSIIGWFTVLGPGYAISIQQVGAKWFAKKRFALEHIGEGKTLTEAYLSAKKHYDTLQAERQKRVSKVLEVLS